MYFLQISFETYPVTVTQPVAAVVDMMDLHVENTSSSWEKSIIHKKEKLKNNHKTSTASLSHKSEGECVGYPEGIPSSSCIPKPVLNTKK